MCYQSGTLNPAETVEIKRFVQNQHQLKNQDSKTSPHCGTSSSGNIKHYVNWFNQLTVMVASEILRHSKKQHRVQVIEYFIDVAKECINVGNFNSLMAIVAGLSLPPVVRLKKTVS
ncbi:unnamed protein product [Anisakis simplex]|uniref:Ras-GEF domain-containing protein n=1 Tax=Anisakis simplex TaxID=6269 RepID=A0A0M3JFN0_ANISI|nr:unnamed protein product [Anisakis simplex]